MVFDRITYHEMKQLIDKMPANTTIIDVREHQEVRQTGVIGSSVNIPLSELKNALKKMNDKAFHKKYGVEKPAVTDHIIFYCLKEDRAERGADIVQSFGYKNIKIFEGGFELWEENEKN
ncbi:unnamed protein product [Callosobruchus maculatus]|nr:unnamed protein product [Callosobruchus maculatus]